MKKGFFEDLGPGVLAGFLFALASLALYGYTLGVGTNHAFYLPWVLSVIEPGLYPGDPAVEAVGRAPTFFWHLFAAAADFGGIKWSAFLLWFGSRFLGGLAVHRAARALGAGEFGAGLAVGFAALSGYLFINSPLAGDPMFKGFLDQTSFAWPLVLLALCSWLEGSHRVPFFLLGLIANLNPLTAGLSALWLALAERFERGLSLEAAGKRGALFLIGAAPILIWAILNGSRGSAEIMLACSPNTYLAQGWPWERWFGAFCAVSLWLALFLRHHRSSRLCALLGSGLALAVLGAVAGWVPALHPLTALQFFRIDVLLAWLAAAAAGGLLESRLRDPRPGVFLPGLAACWSLACVFAGPLLALWGALLVLVDKPRALLLEVGLLGAAYGTAALFVAPGSLFHLPPTAAAATVLFGVLAGLGGMLRGRVEPLRGTVWIAASCALLILWMPLAVGFAQLSGIGLDWTRRRSPAEAWARSSRRQAAFLVAPHTAGFRLRSRRRVYAEWSDFNLALFDREAAEDWRRRMVALGLDWPVFVRSRARAIREWDRALLRRSVSRRAGGFPRWTPENAGRLFQLGRSAEASFIVAPEGLTFPGKAIGPSIYPL